MPKEIYLSGITTDQLSEMIRESVRAGLQDTHLPQSSSEPRYLTRKETAGRLKGSIVTLTNWVNCGKIKARKIGGRVLFLESDVESALTKIVPLKYY